MTSILRKLARWRDHLFGRTQEKNSHLALGHLGENLAAAHLKAHGYKVLRRNFRAPHGGEVDIVCRDKSRDELVFIEVKTRSSNQFGNPHEAVDQKKRQLILRGAMAWLRMLDMPDLTFRFDIIEVIVDEDGPDTKPNIRHHEDAFPLPDRYTY